VKWLFFYIFKSFSSAWYWARRRFSKAGIFLIFCLALFASVGLDTNITMAYQGFVVLFTIFLLSTIWCCTESIRQKRFRKKRQRFISAERLLPRFGTVGERIEYQVTLRNHSTQSIQGLSYLEDLPDPRPQLGEFLNSHFIEEEKQSVLDRHLGSYRWTRLIEQKRSAILTEQFIPSLAANRETEMKIDLIPNRRGYIRFEGMTFAMPDLFGLIRTFDHHEAQQSLLILPKRYSLPNYALPGRRQYQQGGVALASSVGESEEFVSLREYRPGDPLRRIHWRSWAKTGKPVVKEYQDEFFIRHALILDTFLENTNEAVFEEAVSLASSFACTIQTQDSLLDLMFVGTEAYCFTAGRGVSHTEKMLEILAGVIPCTNKPFMSLHNLIMQHVSELSGCVCIFLQWDHSRQELIHLLKSLSIPLHVFVITDREKELINAGPMKDQTEHFHVLRNGHIQADLHAMGSL
jgi:hypothetical protein